MRELFKKNYFKITSLSSKLSTLNPIFQGFSPTPQFIPIITFSSNLKFNPIKHKELVLLERKFYIDSIVCRRFLIYLTNQTNLSYNFNFFKSKKIKIKFRKKKNIFFNIRYKANIKNTKSFFFLLPKFLRFFLKTSKQLYLKHGFYSNILKLKEQKNSLKFFFFNLHYLLAYENNLTFIKANYIFVLTLTFFDNYFNNYLRESLFYYFKKNLWNV